MFGLNPVAQVIGWAGRSCWVILGLKQKKKTEKSQPKQLKQYKNQKSKPKRT